MKTILIPVDFSSAAETALYYAIELAKHEDVRLLLLHVYRLEEGVPEIKTKKEINAELKSMGAKIDHAGDVLYDLVSRKDDLRNGILETIKEKCVDLVVMGTNGESDLSKIVLGSNTARIVKKTECPVIVVPDGTAPGDIRHITYAADYHYSDLAAINKLLEIARPYNAQVNILHISELTIPAEDEKRMMEKFKAEAESLIDYSNISFQLLSGEDVEEKLKDYIESGGTDLLAMSTHSRTLLERLFGRSLTNDMAYYPKVPVMVFHYNKDAAVKVY